MLCSLSAHGNLLSTWAVITAIGLALTLLMSAALFRHSYWKPSFEQWRRKSDPVYPPPARVRREVLQMLKGAAAATLPPALSLHLVNGAGSKAYCGVGELGVGYLVASFFLVWVVAPTSTNSPITASATGCGSPGGSTRRTTCSTTRRRSP